MEARYCEVYLPSFHEQLSFTRPSPTRASYWSIQRSSFLKKTSKKKFTDHGRVCNTAGIDSARARQKAREFFPPPFFWGFVFERGFWKTHFSKCVRARVRPPVRLSVRPSVQKPIALESVDFASPKMRGSKETFSYWDWLPYDQSILCSKKGLGQKVATSCQRVSFFCEIHNSHIFPAVSPQRGLTSINEWRLATVVEMDGS